MTIPVSNRPVSDLNGTRGDRVAADGLATFP